MQPHEITLPDWIKLSAHVAKNMYETDALTPERKACIDRWLGIVGASKGRLLPEVPAGVEWIQAWMLVQQELLMRAKNHRAIQKPTYNALFPWAADAAAWNAECAASAGTPYDVWAPFPFCVESLLNDAQEAAA